MLKRGFWAKNQDKVFLIMAYENLILEDKSFTKIITITRPKVHNALNRRVLAELEQAMLEADSNKNIRCLILTGAGDKSFVAGADIAEMKSLGPLEAEMLSTLGHRVMDLVGSLRIPVIAAVNGYALGGGLELALACDFIYASENASFGLVESKLGLIPGFGGIARLARRVGTAYAKEMIFSGAQINAQEALRVGLVNRLVGEGEVLEMAKNLGDKISERGPYAVALAKKALKEAENNSMSTMNTLESMGFALAFCSRDHSEGISAFLEKRSASFEGL
jgi:enoyl-CoA hydratase